MNHTQAFIATTALTLLSGAAFGAQTNTYPNCIASQDELAMQEIARTMVHSLTAVEQQAIASLGGLGSDAISLAGFEPNAHQPELAGCDSAIEYLELMLDDELRAQLTDEQVAMVTNVATLIDQGTEMPALCFAPGTNPKFAALINNLLDYHFVSGDDDDTSRFQQGTRWSRTATDGSGLGQGDPTTITYSFAPDGTFIPNTGLGSGTSRLYQWLDAKYGNTATWQSLFHQVFDRWEELTGVTYVWEQNDDSRTIGSASGVLGLRGDVRISAFNYPLDGNFGVLAYNSFPNNGDMVIDAFDSFYNSTSTNSIRLRNVVSHEHGHGLGMAHVCPQNSTKLMEPSATLSFDGPQLDDILNGQRHYGDPMEPNDTFGTASDLGTYAGAFAVSSVERASIDDNSDFDIYSVTLSERARITFSVSPDADEYLNGAQNQNGSCSSGSPLDYNSLQDLQLEMFANGNLVTPVAFVNNTPKGSNETISFDFESAGVHYIKVSPANVINNVQAYRGSLIITALPPIVCPADINDDGSLDFFDISDFLDGFASQTADGDFNNDGTHDFFDVSDFLDAFSAGCP